MCLGDRVRLLIQVIVISVLLDKLTHMEGAEQGSVPHRNPGSAAVIIFLTSFTLSLFFPLFPVLGIWPMGHLQSQRTDMGPLS